MKQSLRIAFGGIITALSVLILIISAVIPATEYALPLFAGLLLIPIATEISERWAWLVFAAVSILALIIAPKKESAVVYVSLLGYYPLIKGKLEKIPVKPLSYAAKFLLFNISTAVSMLLLAFVFRVPMDDVNSFGKYTMVIFAAVANAFFFVYDLCLNRVMYTYVSMLSKHLSKYLR